MERLAARFVTWGIAASGAAIVTAIACLLWLEQSAQAVGPGVGLGLFVVVGVALALLLVPVLVGTLANRLLRYIVVVDTLTLWQSRTIRRSAKTH